MRRSLTNAGTRISGIGPKCRACGALLDLVWSPKRRALFWGCPGWPECNYALNLNQVPVEELTHNSDSAARDAHAIVGVAPKLGRKLAD